VLARSFNWQFADYSKPATTFINSGVGNNGCERSQDCPSVKGQLLQSSKKSFDLISISSGVGDCSLARSKPEELQQEITRIFQDFRVAYPRAVVFTTSLTYPNISSRSECNLLMNSIIKSSSEASGVVYLDVSDVITMPRVQMTRDGSHLSESGHALMANSVIDLLRKEPTLSKFLEE
jgi:lysophospholipase L1-like esterase